MDSKNYSISNESLSMIVHHASELFETASFLHSEFSKEVDGDFRKEVLSDGCLCRMHQHYDNIVRLANIVSNDGRLSKELRRR